MARSIAVNFFRSLGLSLVLLVGVSVSAHAQPVVGPGGICGGIMNAQCAKGSFCEPLGSLTSGCEGFLVGTCVAIPTICTFEYRPVCGCKRTYSNDCVRRANADNLRHAGACTAEELKQRKR